MILGYLETLHELPTIDGVWAHLVRHMQTFGFDRLLYGFTRYRTSKSFGDRDDILMLSNHDESFLRAFVDGGMYANAPMVNWAAHNVGACSWSWVAENLDRLSDKERAVVEFNRRHGIAAGYSISFKDISSRAKGAIGLVARPGMSQNDVDALWDEHGRVILQINNATHLKLSSLPFPTPRRQLTHRQREVLEWVGDGKTTQDIATIMDLRPATIEKHLRLAREALDVETTAQAVLKASIHHQIFLLADQ